MLGVKCISESVPKALRDFPRFKLCMCYAARTLCNLLVGVMDWDLGLESWSEVMDCSIGVDSWSGNLGGILEWYRILNSSKASKHFLEYKARSRYGNLKAFEAGYPRIS